MAAKHHNEGFGTCFFTQRYVNRHLVAVKVGVERSTYQRVQTHGASFNQFWKEGTDTQTVQRRRTVEQYRIAFDNFFNDRPDSFVTGFDQFFSLFRVVDAGMAPEAVISLITNGLNRLIAISRGIPHWYIFRSGPTAITERPEKSTRLPSRF